MEKADAIIIRQADFSESSRVVTLFSREFGKFGCLAKGAKRLKGPFDAALDLLSTCRIVFIRKSSGALGILTQATLVRRFAPVPTNIHSLYGGYYVADLLCKLTEDFDPDARIFDAAERVLSELSDPEADPPTAIVQFEITLLRLTGHFPDLTTCNVCGEPVQLTGKFAHWVSQGGVLCVTCRRPEFEGKSISAGSLAILQKLADGESSFAARVRLSREQIAECHQLSVSVITSVLGRKPGTLQYLKL
jgi:DNA repair protein RecO (recombination protein O)